MNYPVAGLKESQESPLTLTPARLWRALPQGEREMRKNHIACDRVIH